MRLRNVGALAIVIGVTMVMVPGCAESMRGPRQSRNPVPMSPCEKKCDDAQEKAGESCSGITAEKEREKCQTDAYEEAKSCKAACKKDEDCLEKCKELCDQIWERCDDDCKKDKTPGCKEKCMNAYSACLKDCDKRCK